MNFTKNQQVITYYPVDSIDMTSMVRETTGAFDVDISKWDTAACTNMGKKG